MYALASPPPSTLSRHPFHPHNTATKAAPAHAAPSQHWVWQLEACPEACSGKNQLLSTKPIVGRDQGGSQDRGAQGRCQAKLSQPELCVLSGGSRGRSRQKRSVAFFLHFLHLNMHTVPWAAQQTQARVHIHSSHSHTHTHNMCMHTQTPHHSTHKPGFSDRLTLLHTFLLPSLFPHTCGHTCPTPGPAHLDPFSTAGPFFHPASAWDTPCVPVRPTHHNSPSRERKC